MSKKKMFDEDNEENPVQFTVNEGYASRYTDWRKKEEMQKLKARHGNVSLNDFDDDASDLTENTDNSLAEITEEAEKDFLERFSAVKSRNYSAMAKAKNSQTTESEAEPKKQKKKKKKDKDGKEDKPMYLKDYAQRVLLERGGHMSDEDESKPFKYSKTFVEQERELKDSFKNINVPADDDDDLLVPRSKTADEKKLEEADYREWLKGHRETLEDEGTAEELRPLKQYWQDPKLTLADRFLRDYILNRRYAGEDDDVGPSHRIPTYDEIIGVNEEDTNEFNEKQDEFEHKFNFRFQEPDKEFVKNYPRTIDSSLRRKNEKRKEARESYKERKEKEKQQRAEEIKRLKNLKRQEIEEKLAKLKKTAGTEDLPLGLDDLDKDFDPKEYDNAMKAAFDANYYDDIDDEKPEFSDDDDILGDEADDPETWDDWGNKDDEEEEEEEEDDDDDEKRDDKPSKAKKKETPAAKKAKKSQLRVALETAKPRFNPNEKTFDEYFDEYYKLDYADMLKDGTLCRFRYRNVMPNSFGLTTEEILAAKDSELNAWVSVKRLSQYVEPTREKSDVNVFNELSKNLNRKRKYLGSLYKDSNTNFEQKAFEPAEKRKRRKKKKTKEQSDSETEEVKKPNNDQAKKPSKAAKQSDSRKSAIKEKAPEKKTVNGEASTSASYQNGESTKKRKHRRKRLNEEGKFLLRLPDDRLAGYGLSAQKFKNDLFYKEKYLEKHEKKKTR